jgi:hypothetical protein
LLLDDITRLKMHRADDQDTLDLIRAFMSMHATLVLIGVNIPGSGLLREGRHDPRTGQWVFPPPSGGAAGDDPSTQTERRFDLVHLEPFRYDTPENIAAWTAHLADLERHLRLFRARRDMLTGGTMPEYLFRRTGGVVGLLERLVEEGCAEAQDTGAEQLTDDLLDTILINLGNDPTRDPAAGEVPPVPAVTSLPQQPKRRGRNPGTRSSTIEVQSRHELRHDEQLPTMTTLRPLPRSVDPLPEESLPGYLLRLAHRLDISPAHAARLTGLNALGTIPISRMFALDPDQTEVFRPRERLDTYTDQLAVRIGNP